LTENPHIKTSHLLSFSLYLSKDVVSNISSSLFASKSSMLEVVLHQRAI